MLSEHQVVRAVCKQTLPNWIIFTGAPGGGKRTTQMMLTQCSRLVHPETIKTFAELEVEEGRNREGYLNDDRGFRRCMLRKQVAIETELPGGQLIFLNKAVPDYWVEFVQAGLSGDDPQLQEAIRFAQEANRYQKIFLFDLLPSELSDLDEYQILQSMHWKAYEKFFSKSSAYSSPDRDKRGEIGFRITEFVS